MTPFYPHKETSIPDKEHKKYPYLLKNLLICRPNQVWAADITYIRLAKGFCYLIAIIDWYSKYILSYRISTTLGRALDNIIIERFFRSLKHEDIYLKEYRCLAELKTGVAQYMFKYNHKRLHEALDYRTPAEIYFARKEEAKAEESKLQTRKLLLEIAV